MKSIKILFCAVITGALALAANQSAAGGILLTTFPLVKLNPSGSITYSDGDTSDNGTVTKGTPLKHVSFNTKKLIDLLNASPTFMAALTNQFGSASSNQVPAGSYFVWSVWTDDLIITNKNGFSFNLFSNLADDQFGFMEIDEDFLFGTFTRNDDTAAGNEHDVTGFRFFFNDFNGNEIDTYGTATLQWSYGAESAGTQKTTLNVSANANSWLGEVSGFTGAPVFRASGSGKGTDPAFQNPFYFWFFGPL